MSHNSDRQPKSPLEGIKLDIPSINLNNLKDLNTKRSSIKGRITKYKNFLVKLSNLDTISPVDLGMMNQRLDSFKQLSSVFEDVQSQIEILNSSNLDSELELREEIESDFSLLIAKTQLVIEKNLPQSANCKLTNQDADSNCNHSCSNAMPGFKLPTIKISNFDGTYYKWCEFRDSYVALIHRNDRIESIHKFHYLNSYLEGEAARVISNMEVSSANYEGAWHLLCERYNNEKQLINNHLNSLCNIQTIPRDSARSLRFLIDHISQNLRALNTLGEPTDSWDTLIVHLVSAKLDSNTNFKWEEHRSQYEKSPTLKDFFSFLKNRADVLESVQQGKNERQSYSRSEAYSSSLHKGEKSHTRSLLVSADSSSLPACILCNGSHRLYDCASFLSRPVADRVSEVTRLRLCPNCLRKGHSLQQCRLGPCSICKKRHNTLLHRETSQAVNISNIHTSLSTSESELDLETNENIVSMSVKANHSILLSTALVDVYNPHTNTHITVRALLDSGSQSSIITERLKTQLQLTPHSTKINIVGIGNHHSLNSLEQCSVELSSKRTQFRARLSCIILPQITSNIPCKNLNLSKYELPPHLALADPQFYQSAPVDILLGADIFWTLIQSQQVILGSDQPIMHETKLGWILAGPIPINNFDNSKNNILCNFVSNETLNDQLTKFWELEQIPQPNNNRTVQEIDCENHFIKHTYRNKDGRFCVRLPLLSGPECLGDSYISAKRQFLSLEKRLVKDSDLKLAYNQFIKEYSNLGHLSESSVSIPDQSYFIPHHAVLKPHSESTRLRVVFNGSAKSTSGYSVNDLQMIGPHIQDSLFNILLRFRQYTYVLSGDIEKMYRQIEIQDSDRNLQMILWRDNETKPLKSLKLNTVTYGLSSSSFLSTRCLWQIGEECSDPKIKRIIQNDFLVDDLLTGSDSPVDLAYIKVTVERALSTGCFNLRKYRSNLQSLLVESLSVQRDLIISSSTHTLGVGWNPTEDYINFPSSYNNTRDVPTKRSILSDSCRVFDPLGLLSLITIIPKILIQRLWLEKINWDQPVPLDICQSWRSFINSISHIQSLQIPRNTLCKSPAHIELHCFCDASQSAYATCIYFKSIDEQGNVTVRLLCAKARVASVKPTTIPRLELCACLLGAQLTAAVSRAVRCMINRKIFWTDSSIVLAWLGMRYDKLKTFVANRVSSILDLTDGSEWRHVPTHSNPADLASRGVDTKNIHELDLWWCGPTFLNHNESAWPIFSLTKFEEIPEIKININTISTNVENYEQTLIKFNRYSKLSRLQRSLAYVLRFIQNCKNPLNKNIGILQPDELTASLEVLVKLAQKECFQKELKIISSGKPLNPNNFLISLSPFIDEKKVLRVGGRLDNSCYTFEKRHPMLLHSKHALTKLIFRQEHLRLFHAGPQLLLSAVREFIWPIAGRDLARTTARQCVVCRKAYGKVLTPMMGKLPKERVDPGFPFLSTGVDFAGPFLITDRKGRGCKISKCYLCIFVCLKYKCLHLEAVSELSKDAFILSLRRFISRRGKPQHIFCDNGRNFVAASREIGEFINSNADDISSFSSGEGIEFKFQPAYAPHFGGLWEASVKSAKFHLKRILGNSYLTFEELATLFSQIEAVLNSRPLYLYLHVPMT